MSGNVSTPLRADYGIDAPGLVTRFGAIGAGGLILGQVFCHLPGQGHSWSSGVAVALTWIGVWMGISALWMVWGSKVGKMRQRDRVLNAIPWRGDEQVLDIGCGRGLLTVGAARRLSTGKVTGIDLWQTEDQSGNSPEATRANLAAEAVADRVELKTGNAVELPFPDRSFDVIVSSYALHNIYDKENRETAIREVARTLKDGGHVAIIDIQHAREYARILEESGLCDVHLSGPSFTFLIPEYVVTASRAGSAE